jgi:hypothetical protein
MSKKKEKVLAKAITNGDTVKVFYLRDETKHPVVLVATDKVDDTHIVYATATHNPKDQFDRTTARIVALGRLHKQRENPSNHFEIKPGVRGQIVQDILQRSASGNGNDLADSGLSIRAHKAALHWLNSYRPEARRQIH